jgi:hypothetical protein
MPWIRRLNVNMLVWAKHYFRRTGVSTLVLEVRLAILYEIFPVLEGLESGFGYKGGRRVNAKLVDDPHMADERFGRQWRNEQFQQRRHHEIHPA